MRIAHSTKITPGVVSLGEDAGILCAKTLGNGSVLEMPACSMVPVPVVLPVLAVPVVLDAPKATRTARTRTTTRTKGRTPFAFSPG